MIGGPWPGIVIAVNDVGSHWPRRLDHWVTLHAEKIRAWTKDREKNGYPSGYLTWGSKKNLTDKFIKAWGGGSSGLLAISVAFELQCPQIVLCGVPMQKMPHFKESKVHQATRDWTSADTHWRAWIRPQVMGRMQGRVRSMSGRTMEHLGYPDLEWLQMEPSNERASAVG